MLKRYRNIGNDMINQGSVSDKSEGTEKPASEPESLFV